MTAPVRPVDDTGKPLSRVLSLDEFNQAQSLPGSALKSAFGGTAPPDGRLSRVLSLDEFEQAQTMTGPAVKTWKIPALPKFAPRDVTRTALTAGDQKGTKIGGLHGALLRQVVDPMLENPFTTIGTTGALAMPVVGPAVGLAMAGQAAYHIAQYGWQKAAELSLSPEDRKRAEADPERLSGEAAAVQAAMLGLAPLIHVGVKTAKSLDYGAGVTEAGAAGVKGTRLGPDFPHAAAVDASVVDYQALRVQQDKADLAATPLSTLITGDELSTARAADAKRVIGAPRRRPQGSPAAYFESPQGAETLGAVAARHGLPDDANPYHPSTGLAEHWDAGHAQATESFRNLSETGFAHVAGDEPSAVMLPAEGAGRAGSTVDAVARAKELVGPEQLRTLADAEWARRGAPDTPESRMAAMEQVSREVASSRPTEPTPSYPDGFAMGGIEGRIPDVKVPRARGSDLPEGATPETVALANALKPSRFRGHSTDALAEAALDAQTAVEQAQGAVERARTGPLTSEAAQADMENRGVSYSDSPEGTSVTAEKQLAVAKSRLSQIEREFALRGVSGDELAGVMQAAKEQRLEREGMQQDQTLADLSDKFNSPEQDQSRRTPLAVVEGTGPSRPRGLSVGVQRKAVVNKLNVTLGDVPEYRSINMADQSDRAVALLESDPALARRVALGEAPAPDGLLPESVFVAVENAAIAQGDVATIRDLATGKLTSEATTMGQRIRALGERDPESPVAAIKEVITVRMGGAKNVPRATEETVASIRAMLKSVDVTHESWIKFVNSLRC